MKKYISLLLFLITSFLAVSQSVYIDWQQCYGGTAVDKGKSVKLLNNGHLITLSVTKSNDIDVSFNHGYFDFWLFETDENGNMLWEKTFGGSDKESPVELLRSPDGGFILFGETWSNDGDVSGAHGGSDYWLLKTDSIGNMLWQRCLGSSMNNIPVNMDIDSEGNIYVIGLSLGIGGDITANNGAYDYWFVKINPAGEIIWDKNLGGPFNDFGMSITVTDDGGVIVGGSIDYSGDDITCNTEPWDIAVWVVKLDSINNIEWQQCYGGTYTDNVVDIKNTNDGGYIILGLTNSDDGDVSGFHGLAGTTYNFDIWVIKIDSLGSIEWQRCLGGTHYESPRFIEITPEGNYLIGGITKSNDGDVSGNHSVVGYSDQWIVKLNSEGAIMWQQCFGSSWIEFVGGSVILSEAEIILIGGTSENNSGNVSCDFKGGGDVWMYKLIDTTVGINEKDQVNTEIKVYPNPAKNYVVFELQNHSVNNHVSEIIIKNIFGQIIETLVVKQDQTAFNTKYVWDIRKVNNGVYIYNLKAFGSHKSGKIVISK